MMELLDPIWAWGILGLGLISLEALTGTFYILCFGIAALMVAGVISIASLSLTTQLMLYSIFSLINLGLWKFKFKKNKKDSKIGQSNDIGVGEVGHVVTAVSPEHNGTISFNMPVMGSKVWLATSEQFIKIGEPAKIVGVEGNYLKVERYITKEQEIFKEMNR